MAKRKVRKTKSRKTKTRRTKKTSRRTPRAKKRVLSSGKTKPLEANKKAHWESYKHLQKRCDQAWAKLKADVKRKAKPEIITKGRNQLLLLLGECNYMARECMRFSRR